MGRDSHATTAGATEADPPEGGGAEAEEEPATAALDDLEARGAGALTSRPEVSVESSWDEGTGVWERVVIPAAAAEEALPAREEEEEEPVDDMEEEARESGEQERSGQRGNRERV